jgi:hypothetical protein
MLNKLGSDRIKVFGTRAVSRLHYSSFVQVAIISFFIYKDKNVFFADCDVFGGLIVEYLIDRYWYSQEI